MTNNFFAVILISVFVLAQTKPYNQHTNQDTTVVHGQFAGFGDYKENYPYRPVGNGLTIPNNGGSVVFNPLETSPHKVIGNGVTIAGESGAVTGIFDGFDSQLNSALLKTKRQFGWDQIDQLIQQEYLFEIKREKDKSQNEMIQLGQGGFNQQDVSNRQNELLIPGNCLNRIRRQANIRFPNSELQSATTSDSAMTTTPTPTSPTTASPQYLSCLANCATTNEYNPVCGTDNINYHNAQKLNCAQFCGKSVVQLRLGTCQPL